MANEHCEKCGAPLNGARYCPACGAAVVQTPPQPVPPSAQTPPVYAAPTADFEQPPPRGSRYSVMGTGSFMGVMLLFSVPLVGLIFMIVWACGGCKSQTKRNFARANLFWILIGIVITVIVAVIYASLGKSLANELQNWSWGRTYY